MNIYLLLQILFVNGDLAERKEYELQRKRREFVAKRRSKQINMDITQLKKNVLIGVSLKNNRFNSIESFAFVWTQFNLQEGWNYTADFISGKTAA